MLVLLMLATSGLVDILLPYSHDSVTRCNVVNGRAA